MYKISISVYDFDEDCMQTIIIKADGLEKIDKYNVKIYKNGEAIQIQFLEPIVEVEYEEIV